MLKYKTGDIFTTKCNIIAHGVNCRGVFNAGIAQQIRRKFPKAFESYISKYADTGWQCGDVQVVKISQELDKYIANLATQYDYGRNGKYASAIYIEECLNKLIEHSLKRGLSIATVRLGCGLGGLNWEEIQEIFEKSASKSLVYMEVWSLN